MRGYFTSGTRFDDGGPECYILWGPSALSYRGLGNVSGDVDLSLVFLGISLSPIQPLSAMLLPAFTKRLSLGSFQSFNGT